MSFACVCIFREPIAKKDPRKHDPKDESTWQQGWEEMLDNVEQAARFLQEKTDPALVAYECDDDGKTTGVVLRYRPEEVAWIEELDQLRAEQQPEETLADLHRHWDLRVKDLVERSRLPPFLPTAPVRKTIENDCVPPFNVRNPCALSPHPTLGTHLAGEAYQLVPQKGMGVRSAIVCARCAEELAKHTFSESEIPTAAAAARLRARPT